MGMTKRLHGKRAIAFCILLSCFFILLFPQNIHAAPGGNKVALAVQQTFTKPSGSAAAGTFSYELTPVTAGAPMPAGSAGGRYTFSIANSALQTIPDITCTAAGVYNYEIKQQVASPQNGYMYDTQAYTVQVHATSDSSGIVVNTVVKNGAGVKVPAIVFANTYAPLATGQIAAPQVEKFVNGAPSENSVFTFRLEASAAGSPMPAGSSGRVAQINIAGSGTGSFGSWQYTNAGAYYYTVSEVNAGAAGYTYDTMVYTITDVVKDVNGQLVLTRILTDVANQPVSALVFINTYTASTIPLIPPTISPEPVAPRPVAPRPRPIAPGGGGTITAPLAVQEITEQPSAGSAVPQEPAESIPDEEAAPPIAEPLLDVQPRTVPNWSVVSLLMSIAGALLSIISIVRHVVLTHRYENGKYNNYAAERESLEPRYRRLSSFLRAFAVPTGILTGIAFLLLDNLFTMAVWFNKNTIIVAVIFGIHAVALLVQRIIRRRKSRLNDEEYLAGRGANNK